MGTLWPKNLRKQKIIIKKIKRHCNCRIFRFLFFSFWFMKECLENTLLYNKCAFKRSERLFLFLSNNNFSCFFCFFLTRRSNVKEVWSSDGHDVGPHLFCMPWKKYRLLGLGACCSSQIFLFRVLKPCCSDQYLPKRSERLYPIGTWHHNKPSLYIASAVPFT